MLKVGLGCVMPGERGVPHKERWVEVGRLLTVVSRAVQEKRMSSWRCGEAGAPTLHS